MSLQRIIAWAMRGMPSGAKASTSEVRAEIWRLGARHLGWPLEGALRELKAPDLSADRAALLRACVRKLQSEQTAPCG